MMPTPSIVTRPKVNNSFSGELLPPWIASLDDHVRPQRLLFSDTMPPMGTVEARWGVPDAFYTEGYCLVDDVSTNLDAFHVLEAFVASLDASRLGPLGLLSSGAQLAKADLIPVCCDVVETSFQPLHFDMGQPLISGSPQDVFCIVGLYCPLTSSKPGGTTRIVNIPQFASQRSWGTQHEIDRRLRLYADRFGDGWSEPSPVNTGRLACFARLVDAVAERFEFASYIDKTMGEWFQIGKPADWQIGHANESEFYRRCGLDMPGAEHRIRLEPGQLLIMDNFRVVHGRIGKRAPRELCQFIYGVPRVDPSRVESIRGTLASYFCPN